MSLGIYIMHHFQYSRLQNIQQYTFSSKLIQFNIPLQMHQLPSLKMNLFAILIFCFLATVNSLSTIEIGNRIINTQTNYLFKIDFNSSNLNKSGKTTIQFPDKGYTQSQLSSSICTPYPCSRSNLTLTIDNSNIPDNQNPIQINISNIINPGSSLGVTTQNVNINIDNGSGIQSLTVPLNSFTPGTLQSCSIFFSIPTVNTNSSATFTVKTSNQITNGRLLVQLPNNWKDSWTNSSITLVNPTTCNTTATNNISCSYISFSSKYLILNNITAGSNNIFSVTVSSFISPPTTNLNTQINASTSDSDSNSVDNNIYCSISGLFPKTLTINNNAQINQLVSTNFSPQLNFSATDPITGGDILQITTSAYLTNVDITTLSFSGGSVNENISLVPSSTYQYKIPGSAIISSSSLISLQGMKFLSGAFSKNINDAFIVRLSRNGGLYSNGSVIVKFIPNAITTISLNATPTLIQKSASFNIQFVTVSPLSTDSLIIVNIPSNISSFSCQNSLKINGNTVSSSCSNTTIGFIIIRSFATNQLPSGTRIIVPFTATNPVNTRPLSFQISTAYNYSNYNSTSSEGTTDSGSVNFTPTPQVSLCSVFAGSLSLGALTSYNLSCNTTSLLPTNSVINIVIPDQFTVNNISVSLFLNNTMVSSSLNYSLKTVTISNFNNNNVGTNTNVVISISNLINPSNFSNTDSFSIAFSYDSFIIEGLSSGLAAKMTLPGTFLSTNIKPQSLRNGDTTNYDIAINTSIIIKNGYILNVEIPLAVGITNPVCNSSAISCSSTGNTLSIVMGNYDSNSLINIKVSGFTNPRTYSPTGNFIFSLLNAATQYQTGTFPGFSNSIPNQIQDFTMTLIDPSQSFLNSLQTIKFSVVTKNNIDLSTGEYFILSIPPSFGNGSLRCQQSQYICTISSNNIKISSLTIRSGSSFQFTIVNIRTALNYQQLNANNKTFNISSYTSINTIIDTTNSTKLLTFTLSCDPQCETCSTNNISQCLTCYSNATLFNGQCTTCIVGQFKNQSTGNCDKCNTTCKTCEKNSYTCTSCKSQYFLYQSNCLLNCPANTTGIDQKCQQCSTTCDQCQNSTSSCVNCAQNYLKRSVGSNQCVLTCDQGLVPFNGTCQCFNCLTCSGIYTNCTSCNPNSEYHYFYKSSCLKQCPPSTYGSGDTCLPCMQGCLKCTATQCLDQLQNSLSSKLIPIPFSLGTIVVVVLGVLSKVVSSDTYIPSFVLSLGGILQVLCWIVIMGILNNFQSTIFRKNGSILIGIGLGINYVLNIGNIIVFWKYLMRDRSFSLWFRKQSSKINGKVSLILSIVFSHRYIHILFSKAFNSQSLRAPLESPLNIVPLYIIAGMGFLSEILVIAGCANIAYDPRTYNRSQLFMECIDGIVLNIMMIIFVSWNFIKPDEFFKPSEINKYQDKDVFKNNQTIQDLNDNYLQNLELEQVIGSIGGRPKYSNTRFHLQGLHQKSLQKNKQTLKSHLMTKIIENDSESVIAHKLITKLVEKNDRNKLEGISQSSEQAGESNSMGSRQPLSPQKQYEKPKVSANMTNFQENNLEKQSNDQISISNDSLVRYEIPLQVQQGDIIFAPKQGKISSSQPLQKDENLASNSENLMKKKNSNLSASQKIKLEAQVGDENTDNRIQFTNQFGHSDIDEQSEEDSFNQIFNYLDQDQVPQLPVMMSNQIDPDNSTCLDHVPQQTNYNWKNKSNTNVTKTNYTPKVVNNKSSKGFKQPKNFNQTTMEFRKKIKGHEDMHLEQQPNQPIISNNKTKSYNNNRYLRQEEYNGNQFNLPEHKFQTYFQDDTDNIFSSSSNQINQIKRSNASVGSIKKTGNSANLSDQDITRGVVSRHILAPQTPMRMPKVSQSSNLVSITQPLATITEHQPSLGSIRIQNPMLSQKLKSVQKIYLQKLNVKDNRSKRE